MKLLGHVFHALLRRMELGDGEVRRHAAHDMSIGDLLGLYVDGPSVVLQTVKSVAGDPPIRMEHDSRAVFYAVSILGAMAKYKSGRIYLLSESGGAEVLESLLTCVENAWSGKVGVECGVVGLVALSRLTCEIDRAKVPARLLELVSGLLKELNNSPPTSSYFLQKLMIDSDDVQEEEKLMEDPDYQSPIKRSRKWNVGKSWLILRSTVVAYGSALCCNVCGGGEQTNGVCLINFVTAVHNLKKGGSDVDLPYISVLLRGCYGLLKNEEAKESAKKVNGEEALKEIEGYEGEEGWMVLCLLKRLRGEEEEVEEGGGEEGGGEVDTMEEDMVFGFQKVIEGEEKIHAAIEHAEGDELPPGWNTAEDPTTGLKYFYKSDSSDSMWTLPSASDKILEAFYLTKHVSNR